MLPERSVGGVSTWSSLLLHFLQVKGFWPLSRAFSPLLSDNFLPSCRDGAAIVRCGAHVWRQRADLQPLSRQQHALLATLDGKNPAT